MELKDRIKNNDYPRTFDLVFHKPSNKVHFCRFVRPNYEVERVTGVLCNQKAYTTGFWLWNVMPNKIGGSYSGSVMELIAYKWAWKWWINIYRIWL